MEALFLEDEDIQWRGLALSRLNPGFCVADLEKKY